MVSGLQERLRAMVEHSGLRRIIRFLISGHRYGTERIRSVWTKHRIEIGRKFHRVHGHLVIKIEHYSKIRLDPHQIRALLRESGLPEHNNVHVDIKLLPADEQRAIEYLLKDGSQADDLIHSSYA